MQNLSELKKAAIEKTNHTVAIANAADMEVLEAVKVAVKEEFCSFLLVGDKETINNCADKIDLDLSSERISVDHTFDDPAEVAVKAVHNQKATILMKGDVSTKQLLQAVLHKEYGLRSGNVLSHVALFEIPNATKLLFLTDAAMNIKPTVQEKNQIIQNAVKVAHGININHPKVAILGAVEVVNPAMEATTDAAILTQMQKRNQITGCCIDGPLAFDNAISEAAAVQKGIQSEVAGDADMLVVPTIEVGNALYKSFMYFADAKVAAIISGATAPIVLTSRADSSESKLNSLALALASSKTF